jgi:hypothetical protein
MYPVYARTPTASAIVANVSESKTMDLSLLLSLGAGYG